VCEPARERYGDGLRLGEQFRDRYPEHEGYCPQASAESWLLAALKVIEVPYGHAGQQRQLSLAHPRKIALEFDWGRAHHWCLLVEALIW
jgi:hypothetical protein